MWHAHALYVQRWKINLVTQIQSLTFLLWKNIYIVDAVEDRRAPAVMTIRGDSEAGNVYCEDSTGATDIGNVKQGINYQEKWYDGANLIATQSELGENKDSHALQGYWSVRNWLLEIFCSSQLVWKNCGRRDLKWCSLCGLNSGRELPVIGRWACEFEGAIVISSMPVAAVIEYAAVDRLMMHDVATKLAAQLESSHTRSTPYTTFA